MLNNKLSKKVLVPALVGLMIMGTSSVTNAYTVYRSSNNSRFVYNVTRNYTESNTYSFKLSNYRFSKPSTTTPAPAPKPAPAPTPAPAPAPVVEKPSNTSNEKHSLSANEIQMVQMVNEERTKAGLKPLEIDVNLSYVARVKSKDMSDHNYFSHTSPTYGSPFDMMRSFGISYRSAAENIARTSSLQSAHTGLMNSEGHRRNIMNPNFTHIGIGIHNGYYTQMFISK